MKSRISLLVILAACCLVTAATADPPDLILCNESLGTGIWSIESDGSNLQELSDFGWFAEYSRGGNMIAFSKHYKAGIWVMEQNGDNPREIYPEGIHPSWSPDGTKIVFEIGTTYAYDSRIWMVDADGSNPVQLTTRVGSRPNFAHFSDVIVFGSYNDGIWLINADGSGETQILGYGRMPAWGPNDDTIVFSSGVIYTMDPTGGSVTPVSISSGYYPCMGPDGRIVFMDGSDNLIMLDGGVETLLAADRLAPDWSTGDSGPPYELGMVFSGVGLIPYTEIEDGYATTEPGYYLFVENAPFGSKLHVFGNFELARGYGVAKYKVQAARWADPYTEPLEGDYEDIIESWGNYVWDPILGEFVYHVISPDDENKYEMPPGGDFWYIDNLLVEWDTGRYSDGKYTLRLKAYRASGAEMGIPPDLNQLVLVVDNTRPDVIINDIIYDGTAIDTCGIVTMAPTDPLDFVITVNDPDGHLHNWNLTGYWGDNSSFHIDGESYDPLVHGDSWTGFTSMTTDYYAWPTTCAYNFRLSARDRIINGYNRIHYKEYNKNITLILE